MFFAATNEALSCTESVRAVSKDASVTVFPPGSIFHAPGGSFWAELGKKQAVGGTKMLSRRSTYTGPLEGINRNGHEVCIPAGYDRDHPWRQELRDPLQYNSIVAAREIAEKFSPEELRLQDYLAQGKVRISTAGVLESCPSSCGPAGEAFSCGPVFAGPFLVFLAPLSEGCQESEKDVLGKSPNQTGRVSMLLELPHAHLEPLPSGRSSSLEDCPGARQHTVATQTDPDGVGLFDLSALALVPIVVSDVLLLSTPELCELTRTSDEKTEAASFLDGVRRCQTVADCGCQTVSPLAVLRERLISDMLAPLEKNLRDTARMLRHSVARMKRWEEAWRSEAGFSCGMCLRGSEESHGVLAAGSGNDGIVGNKNSTDDVAQNLDVVPPDERMIQLMDCDCIVKICQPCLAEKTEMARSSLHYDVRKCALCRKKVAKIVGVSVASLKELDDEVG